MKSASVSQPLIGQYNRLFAEQLVSWPLYAKGYAALASLQSRMVDCGSYAVTLQYNPARIVSSGAPVDAESIAARKCFLCEQNRPVLQEVINYKDEYQLLVNPMPLFPHHGTIVHHTHLAQKIEGRLVDMLELARDLSPQFTIFYNGPRCGASAPDHFHFQCTPRGSIPAENDCVKAGFRGESHDRDGVLLTRMKNYGRSVLVFESDVAVKLDGQLRRFMHSMRRMAGGTDEAMVNILCSFQNASWRVIVFPRKKHRPDAYFADGDERILVSPASVDMGGLIVTPLEKDYLRLDAPTVDGIYREVSLDNDVVDMIVAAM